jgi:hypothetical protein
MKKFDFTTLEGVTISISVNPAGFVRVESFGRSRSMALPKFARALHANPSAVSAEPLEGAVKLRLGDGSVWIVFADTQHISEVPATVAEEEEFAEQPFAATQPQTPSPASAPTPASDGNGNGTTQKSPKVGNRKAAFFQALASVLAARGLSQDEIQDIIANLSATKRRNGGRERIDPSTPEGKLLAAARRLFFFLKRQSVTYWESKGPNLNILFDGKRVTFEFPDGNSVSYPQ